MKMIKGVDYAQTLFRQRRPLGSAIDQLTLLRSSGVDFIPLGNGTTIRTRPRFEDQNIPYREAYIEAAIVYLTNPLCYAATSLLNDEVADGRLIVEEKQSSGKWKLHENNELYNWLEYPNSSMDEKEFRRAYCTHYHTFGMVAIAMFQKGDVMPSGKINDRDNCFDFIFPGRLLQDINSNPHGTDFYYLPIGYENPIKLNPASLFIDVVYNPIAYSLGVSLPQNPLKAVFDIHSLYIKSVKRFFTNGAMPTHLLTRIVDLQKDASSSGITDDEIEAAIDRVYATVGRGASRDGGWLGLRGDWRVNKVGSQLPELINKDLLQYLDALISGVYKIPPSLFWAGMQSSNQRASRQQDSIDFYNMKIKPFQERITMRMSRMLVPAFLNKTTREFRIGVDVSEMALAQYAVVKQYRMYERWYQLRLISRGLMLEWVNEDTSNLTTAEYDSMYAGSNVAGGGLSLGGQTSDNETSVEGANGLA